MAVQSKTIQMLAKENAASNRIGVEMTGEYFDELESKQEWPWERTPKRKL